MSAVQQTFEAAARHHQAGDLDQAQMLYADVLEQEAGHVDALCNLATIMFSREQFDIAANLFGVVMQLQPENPEAAYNRGCSRHRMNVLDGAVADYRHCLALSNGRHQAALENLIAILVERSPGSAEVIELLEARLAMGEDIEQRLLLAEQCVAAGRLDAADDHYRAAIAWNPASPVARYQVTTQQLCTVDDAPAAGLRARWHIDGFVEKNPAPPIPLPLWQGEPLAGKHLFIAAEQGVGDMTMFSSRLRELDAAAVTMQVDARLLATWRHSWPDYQFVAAPTSSMDVPDVDWQSMDCFCFAGDVLHLVRSDEPARGPWLTPEPRSAMRWANWTASLDGPLIGISWRGGFGSSEIEKHSIDIDDFAAVIEGLPATFVLLQYDPQPEECERFGDNFAVPPGLDIRNDLDDVIALTSCLDLVITIDNCNAYFAAGVGTPSWPLLPVAAHWRWRSRMPLGAWREKTFPFHATTADGWQTPLQAMRVQLAGFIEHFSGRPDDMVMPQRSSAAMSTAAPARRRRRLQRTGPATLLVNDLLNSGDWGETIAALGLYDQLSRDGCRLTSLPGYALKGIDAPSDASRGLNEFANRHAAILRALEASDQVVIAPSGDSARSDLLHFLANVAGQHFGKPVTVAEDLDGQLHSGLDRIGTGTALDVRDIVCTMPGTVTAQTAAAMVDELGRLASGPGQVSLLVGGRAGVSRQHVALADFIHQHAGLQGEILWVDSAQDWAATIAAAGRLVTTSHYATRIAAMTAPTQ